MVGYLDTSMASLLLCDGMSKYGSIIYTIGALELIEVGRTC